MAAPKTAKDIKEAPFDNPLNGKLIHPGAEDPIKIGDSDFQALVNMRYTSQGIRGISGMTKINSNTLPANKITDGQQFNKYLPIAAFSYNIAHVTDGVSSSTLVVSDNTSSPPNADTYSALLSGMNYGSIEMTTAPDGAFAACDGVTNWIWGGDEFRCAAFLCTNAAQTGYLNFTAEVNNSLADSNNVATLQWKSSSGYTSIFYVGSVRPLTGIKFYISVAFATASTMGIKYQGFDGAWHAVTSLSDGTAVGGVTLAQTGLSSFASTESVHSASMVNNEFLYWYQITISCAVSPSPVAIFSCSVGAAPQSIKDIWDGIDRSIASFIELTAAGTSTDYASIVINNVPPASDASSGYAFLDFSNQPASTIIYAGFSERMCGIKIALSATVTTSLTLAAYYWNGTDWVAVSTLSDGTSGFSYAGNITWISPPLASEHMTMITGEGPFYYYKIVFSGTFPGVLGTLNVVTTGETGYQVGTAIALTAVTNPTVTATGVVLDQSGTSIVLNITSYTGSGTFSSWYITGGGVNPSSTLNTFVVAGPHLYYVAGIPVQTPILPHVLPILWQDRLWLINNPQGQVNEALCSSANTNCVFNGSDSLTFYFGDNTPILAAGALYSRYGGSLYDDLIIVKAYQTYLVDGTSPSNWVIYTIAPNVGITAPKTFTICDTGYELAPGLTKHIAAWVSAGGPVMFDGNGIIPIEADIKCFWDPGSSYYVAPATMALASAFYDAVFREWHLLFDGMEWVYDVNKKKWWQADRGEGKALNCGWITKDGNGFSYCYAGTSDGSIECLEKGTTMDGNPIDYTMRTGDTPLAKNGMAVVAVRHVKLVAKPKQSASTVTFNWYGDTSLTAIQVRQLDQSTQYGKARVYSPVMADPSKMEAVFHSFEAKASTTGETIGLEPVMISGTWEYTREDVYGRY
jgi:hypothetical protein